MIHFIALTECIVAWVRIQKGSRRHGRFRIVIPGIVSNLSSMNSLAGFW
jgi:hypothetical protein